MDLKRHNYVCHFKAVPDMLLKFYDDFGSLFLKKDFICYLYKLKKKDLKTPLRLSSNM